MSDFKEITEALIRFRNERDWEQFHNPKDLSIALSIEANELLESLGTAALTQNVKVFNLLSRPQVGIEDIRKVSKPFDELLNKFDVETVEQAEIKIKYESYFEKENDIVVKDVAELIAEARLIAQPGGR